MREMQVENMTTTDERTPLQKLRRSQLWRIAVGRGYQVADNVTKDQLLPLVYDATQGEIVKALQDEMSGLGLPTVRRPTRAQEVAAEPLPPIPPQDIAAKEAELLDLPGFQWSVRARAAGLPVCNSSNQVKRHEKHLRIVAEYELRQADLDRETATPEPVVAE